MRLLQRLLPTSTNTLLLIICSLTMPPAHADFGAYQSHALAAQSIEVTTEQGKLSVRAINELSFEVYYQQNGVKQLPSFALSGESLPVRTYVTQNDESLTFGSERLSAVINKKASSIVFFRDGQQIATEESGYFASQTHRGFRFRLGDDEKIIGGGERVLGMDRRGQEMPLYNKAHYGYTTESSQMYYSLPAIMSDKRYAIVFDNSASGRLDIGARESDVLQFEAVAGRTAYIVSAGANFPELIKSLTHATGRQPLPPRWAFGNFASRFGYHSEAEARQTIAAFDKQRIPVDAIVLDLFWFGPDIKGHVGNLDWDREAFPTPEKMIADFEQNGVKTILISEPFILSTSKRWDDALEQNVLARNAAGRPRRFDFYFGNTGLIDVFDDRARDWLWAIYKGLYEQGVAGVWGDLGEPEVHPGDALHWLSDTGQWASGDEIHNVYGHEWAKLVYEKQKQFRPSERAFIMMRSGFVGTQRYGIIPWTGDVSREWGGLKPQVELSLQMSLFGLAYIHSDLGGFAGGEKFDSELYQRWLQFGVFQPVFRPHAQEHIAPEPVFHDKKTRQRAAAAIDLRYRLTPYLYTLAYENATTGMPLMRPLFFTNENDASLFANTESYLWGNDLLVTPITEGGLQKIDVQIPEGIWFDFYSSRRYQGGSSASMTTSRESIPVLVRAGAIIPMAEGFQRMRDYSSEKLTLHYYADASVTTSSAKIYEDDGKSRGSIANGQFEMLVIDAHNANSQMSFALSRSGVGYAGMPESRRIHLIVHNFAHEQASIEVDGQSFGAERLANKKEDSKAWIDSRNDTLHLQFDWREATSKVVVNNAH